MLSSPVLSRCLTVALLMALFCIPALYNRQPLIYPDSVGYFHSGTAAIDAIFPQELALLSPAHAMAPDETSKPEGVLNPADKSMKDRAADGTSTSRSPYYGAGLVILTRVAGQWGLPLVQVLISVLSLLLAARHMGRPGKIALFVVAAVTGVVAGLGLFSTTVMPDVFAGLAILALAILLTCFGALTRVERIYWLALLLVSCLFHKANLAAGVALAVAGLCYLWLSRRRDLALAASVLGALVLAAFGHVLVNVAVEKTSGRPPVQTPFVLARLVGDGTAQLYLERHCPERPYRLCDYLPLMPMTENDFLWSSVAPKMVMKTAPVEVQQAITAEQDEIIKGVLTEFPLQQARISLINVLRQLVTVGVTEYGLEVNRRPEEVPGMEQALISYRSSRIAKGDMPLVGISTVMLATYLAGFLVLAALAASRQRVNMPRQSIEIIGIVVAGVVLNAAVSGVLAGVFDRYQGRVAWLIPFTAMLLWLQLRPTTSARPAR